MIRMLSFLQTTLPAGLDRDREERIRAALDAARRARVQKELWLELAAQTYLEQETDRRTEAWNELQAAANAGF